MTTQSTPGLSGAARTGPPRPAQPMEAKQTKQDARPPAPSEISGELSVFDRFAGGVGRWASRAPFFALCVLLVLLWLIEGAILMVVTGRPGSFLGQTYQLQINTLTTIVTFLLVALLQNTQTRADAAIQHKLNAIADALADFMNHAAEASDDEDLHQDLIELRAAVGLEEREGTSD